MPKERREFDALGRLAPRHLREVFGGRRRLKRWVRNLEKLRQQLAALGKEPFARHLDLRRVLAHMEATKSLVIRAIPHAICGCPGWEIHCPKCEGQRWVTIDNGPKRPPAWRG